MIRVTDTLVIEEHEIRERFVRAAGPGGQHVNKVSTAVELRVDVAKLSLPGAVKDRLIALAGRQVTSDGILTIESREHRSQARNREAARARLETLLKRAATPPRKRRPTRPGAAVREQRLVSKKRQGEVKRSRRPPTDE